jgi:hypothetical protein
MLDLKLLSNELLRKKDDIIGFEREASEVTEEYRQKMELIGSLDQSINEHLGPYSGSKVLEEGDFIRRFKKEFISRSKATDWALEILKGRMIAAVDGSQIFPSRTYSLPIGVAQAGLVINNHTGLDGYSASQKLSIIVPEDFEKHGNISAYSETPVSLQRYRLECEQIILFMREHPGNIVFMDDSLVLSFINKLDDRIQKEYVKAIVQVLQVSEETRSPLVGYTDLPLNKDIITLMKKHFHLKPTSHLTDSYLIQGNLYWGDRTRVFQSDRDDRTLRENTDTFSKSVLDLYGGHRDSIAFFYIQSSGGLPSKIEMPKWAFQAGMTDHIADVVRAECIIRPGYPDIIHRAHEYTVVGNGDAERFNGMLDAFAEQNKIRIYKSAKALNKRL